MRYLPTAGLSNNPPSSEANWPGEGRGGFEGDHVERERDSVGWKVGEEVNLLVKGKKRRVKNRNRGRRGTMIGTSWRIPRKTGRNQRFDKLDTQSK